MTSSARTLFSIVRSTTLLAFAVGLVYALYGAATERWVLEFQAGAESPWADRLLSIATRGTIEGLGFALMSLLLAGVAWLVTTLGTSLGKSSEAQGPRLVACYLLALTAFLAWSTFGTWLGNEALPFLGPGPLVLLSLGGFTAFLLLLGIVAWLEAFVPGPRPDSPVARAAGTILGTLVGATAGLLWLQASEAGWRAASSLAVALVLGLLSVPLARLAARAVERPITWLESRSSRGALAPRWSGLATAVGLLACMAYALPNFSLSSPLAGLAYPDLEPAGAAAESSGADRPNVVLVTVDTLRADHLGAYGYKRPTSPFLDSLAAGGTLFADASASAAWTKPATGTILTGLFPSRHGALYHGSSLQIPDGERTLAEAFREGGYVTAGFVTNPNLKRVFAFDRGFQEYYDSPVEDTVALASIRGSLFGRILMNLTRHQFNWKYENDIFQMNRHISSWLEANADDPFFLYLHYIDPHIPYSPPADYRRQFVQDHGFALFNDRKEKVGIDLYDAEIRYSDDGLAQLAGHLEELGLWENTIFVVTSDHGEEFFEHGVLGHGFSLYQGVIHVPLIAHGPGIAAERRVETPVQIVDLAATLTDLVGLGERMGDGLSFARALQEGAWSHDRLLYLENEFGQTHESNRDFVLNGVREGPYKLVLTEFNAYFPPEDHGGQALFNLDVDPGETENLITSEKHRPIVERLLERLLAHSHFLSETGFRDVEPAVLSADLTESLKALGYL